jgi:predicted glycosyltransferase
MKILLDIGHPAHVHLYRNFWSEMTSAGHEVTVTVKDLPSAIRLLDLYSIPYIKIGKRGISILGKGLSQLLFNVRIFFLVMKKGIRIGLGSSITTAHISRITRMISIVFDDDDDEVQPLMTKYGHPFAHCVVSPDALRGKRKKGNTIFYAGYHELAYLHPARFTPDPSVLGDAGLAPHDIFFIMRFNAFKAHHDVGERGLSKENKMFLAEYLSKKGKVFITSENEIEPELAKYQLKIPQNKIHSFIYYAKMLIGDSQTMTSEAAILGTPAIRCNSFAGRISYLQEQEDKYSLTYAFSPDNFAGLMTRVDELFSTPDLKAEWQKRRVKMLADKIDVTAFMVWFVEKYPESGKILKINPEYQARFFN